MKLFLKQHCEGKRKQDNYVQGEGGERNVCFILIGLNVLILVVFMFIYLFYFTNLFGPNHFIRFFSPDY